MTNKNKNEIAGVTNCTLFILFFFLLFSCQKQNNKSEVIGYSGQLVEEGNTKLYDSLPSFVFKQNGMYATGLFCVDLDNNGYMDVVNANGNDMCPQPLTMYNNWGKETGEPYYLPNYADDKGFNTRIKIGDLNKDGWQDIIMISVFKRAQFDPKLYKFQSDLNGSDLYKPGSVKVYMNNRGSIPSTATYEIELGTFPFDIDLGDFDADGDLDLAVANIGQLNENGMFVPAKSVICLNENGILKNKKIWETDYSFNAMSIKFADVNLDGLLDLTIGHTPGHVRDKWSKTQEAISVFYGKLDRNNKIAIDINVGWSFGFGSSLSAVTLNIGLLREGENSVPNKKDVAFLVGVQGVKGNEEAFKLVNSHRMLNSNNYVGENFFVIGCEEKKVYWKTDVTDMNVNKPSFSSMGDLDNDGYADLVLGFFKIEGGDLNDGAPFFIFEGKRGDANGSRFKQIFRSKVHGVNQEIFLGYARQYNKVKWNKIEQRRFAQLCSPNKPVVTLPCNVVVSIDSVKVDQVVQNDGAYSWNYATNVLTLNNSYTHSVAVEVVYKTPLKKDIYIAYWNANIGNAIYYSQYSKP
jgi:hypothetical protein